MHAPVSAQVVVAPVLFFLENGIGKWKKMHFLQPAPSWLGHASARFGKSEMPENANSFKGYNTKKGRNPTKPYANRGIYILGGIR